MYRYAAKAGRHFAATAATLLLTVLSAQATFAGVIQVNPVNVVLPPDKSATSFSIKNGSSEPVSVRVSALRWTQQEGRDVRSETNDIITSPPIFTIPANGSQLVRLGLRSRTPGAAYRIIVEEIPSPKPKTSGINVALRLDLPLYVLASRGAKADIEWVAWRNGEGELLLEARNRGAMHQQILGIDAIDAHGKRSLLSDGMGVVLPSSARRWSAGKRPGLRAGTTIQLKVRNPSGEISETVVVEAR